MRLTTSSTREQMKAEAAFDGLRYKLGLGRCPDSSSRAIDGVCNGVTQSVERVVTHADEFKTHEEAMATPQTEECVVLCGVRGSSPVTVQDYFMLYGSQPTSPGDP